MGLVINFPKPFRKREAPAQPKPHPFRDATRRRVRAIIEAALHILDSLDRHPPDGSGEKIRKPRGRKARSA